MLATFRSVPLILVVESNLTYMYTISIAGSLLGKLIGEPQLSQIYVSMISAFGIHYALEF